MGKTIVEKILSMKSGTDATAGDIVVAEFDIAMINDASGPLTREIFKKMGARSVATPNRIIAVIDHYVPCPNQKVARLQQELYEFCSEFDIELVAGGEGIAHQILDELGKIVPGSLIIGADSHTITHGFLNCFSVGIGSSDMAMAMHTGSLWFKVPETIRINLSGRLKPLVSGKDVGLHILRLLGSDGANYKSIEFSGQGVSALSMDDRKTICNLMAECGAKCAIMPFDDLAKEYCEINELDASGAIEADKSCSYVNVIEIDLCSLDLLVAKPHSPTEVVELREVLGQKVDVVVIGTCTNGRLSDFEVIGSIMSKSEASLCSETLIIPSSRKVQTGITTKGIAAELLTKGAMILPPGCGPCCGSSPGVPRDNQVVLSTANRNYVGRMGNPQALIYLASPAVAISAAIKGYFVDPREMNK